MRVLVLAILAACVFAHGDHDHDHDHGEAEHVISLTTENFDTTVAANNMILVEFFAPWCGHCKRLAPEYEAAATELYGEIPLAKVDCTVEKDICEKYSVQGFPTIKLFRKDGSTSDYEKGRTSSEIVKFLRKQAQPAFSVLTTKEELETLKNSDNVVIVAFSDAEGSAAKTVKGASDSLRDDAAFGVIAHGAVEGAQANSIVLFRKFDDPSVHYTGEHDVAALSAFIKSESFPLVGEIGPENYQKYVERNLPLVWAFLDLSTEDAAKSHIEILTAVAKTVRGKASFVKLDGNRWNSHAKNLGLSGAIPGFIIEDRDHKAKYIFPESNEVTLETVGAFIKGWQEGTLTAHVKSAEPPAENNEPVKVIVGKTFKEIVMDPTKDVLVEFYAPWCGHCKTLAPKYDALGEEFKDIDTVVIAKVDATENDTPADIQGFPTLIYYPANNKEGLVYRGERTKEAISDYVREHSATLSAEAKRPTAARAKKDEL